MNDPRTEMKLIRLDSLLNIMDRELYNFSETRGSNTIPQRIDDFRALVSSMKEIVQGIAGPQPGRQDDCEIEEDLYARCRCN